MPPLRLYPLLVAGAACLTLAACGSDDDPPPQASAPAQTEAATTTGPNGATTPGGDGATKSGEGQAAPSGKQDTGSPSASEQAKVREALVSLQEAFAAKDGEKACSLMIGIPKKLKDPTQSGLSCESLSQGDKTMLSPEERKVAANAKVTIEGNEATAELAPGVPMTLRKIDGQWRVDYTRMGQPAAGSR